jgi:hypothetical protein
MATHGNVHAVSAVILWREVFLQWTVTGNKSVPSAGNVMLMLVWDLTGPSSSTTRIRQMVNCAQYCVMLCLKRSWNSLLAVNTEDIWQMELFCNMTTHVIWRQWPLKQYENWNSSSSHIQHTVQSSPQLWLPYFPTAQICVTWIPICKQWRGQGHSAHNFAQNWKHSSQMASGSLWTKVTNAWRSYGIM